MAKAFTVAVRDQDRKQPRVCHGKSHLRICLCITTNKAKVAREQNPTQENVTIFAVNLTRTGMLRSNSN
jgi:hypothetical protein